MRVGVEDLQAEEFAVGDGKGGASCEVIAECFAFDPFEDQKRLCVDGFDGAVEAGEEARGKFGGIEDAAFALEHPAGIGVVWFEEDLDSARVAGGEIGGAADDAAGPGGGASDVSESFGVKGCAGSGEDFVKFVDGVGVGGESQCPVDLRADRSAVGVEVGGWVRSGVGHESGSWILECLSR